MVALPLVLVPLLSFIILTIFVQKRRHDTTSPPSPRKLPLIGNLHQLGVFPHRSLQSLSRSYGHLMLLHFGRIPVLVVSSADGAREVLKNQDAIFSNRPKLNVPYKLLYGGRDVAFARYGEHWRQARSISVLHLLSHKRAESFGYVREEETSFMIENIGKLISLSPVINLSDILIQVTRDVTSRVALGRKYTNDGGKFKKLFGEFVELLGTPSMRDYIPWLGWIDRLGGLDARVKRLAGTFDEFLEVVIQEHRERMKRDKNDSVDFVDILLQFQRESKDKSLLENDTIKAIILDMFSAGTDTTATVLEWTMAELIRNPRTMKILQSEVREQAGSKKVIAEDDIPKMRYFKAVIKESLRLHPPIPVLVTRESTEHTKLMGYDIGARTQVMINAWSIARDPLLWKNPEEFLPERFLDNNIDFGGLHFELIPFGGGRRGCPGVTFGMAVIELVLAKFLHRFNFELPNGETEEDLDMSEANGITVHKKIPLVVTITPYDR